MNPKRRVTIKDVAQAAGVSRQTVSRAINDLGEISPETRERVLRVAREMGYRPSAIARGLATQRTRTLGLIVPDNANPFFSEMARGAEHVAYAQGYSVFLCNTEEDPKRELAVLESLEGKCVDGVVLCSSRLEDDELAEALGRHPAAVLVNRRLDADGVGVVMIDDEAGGRIATEHLLRTGHRSIGFLTGPVTSFSGRRRVAGFRTAMDEAGVPCVPDWMRHCPPIVEGGRAAAKELLTGYPELTALVCYNDLVAVGALQTCAELERRVPDDLAVVGFDDIPLAELVTPPLTTCRVPRHELGAQATRILLNQIGSPQQTHKEITLQPRLVVRASAP